MELPNESRRTFIKKYGLGAAALSLLGPAILRSAPRDRPNILYIMSDDHARQAMSCYGSRLISTPNIDRIAQEGVRFNQSFCTNSICAPSRATILTGTYSHVNGQIDNAVTFDGSQVTFPKLLQQAGYQTALVGKWHLKSDPTGFDYWNILPGQGQYYNPDFIEMGKRRRVTGYATDLITDFALNWLLQFNKQRPFCLLLHHKAPHRTWLPGPKHLTLFNDVEFPLPETFFDDYESRQAARSQEMRVADHLRLASDCKLPPLPGRQEETAAERNDRLSWEGAYARMNDEQRRAWDAAYRPMIEEFRRTNPTGVELAKWKFQRYMQDYLRCVVSVDENVGRVLEYLDNEKLSDNTIVIYASDQGFYLGEHGWYDKRFMYEESLAFPLLVRFPAEIKPHVNAKDLVLNLDLAPTFLDYAGVSIPSRMQGESFREVCQQATPGNWRQAMYYHYYEYPAEHRVRRHYGIRTHRYKLIHFYYDIDTWELYDLERDPHELHNVYSDPSYASVIRELEAELKRLRKLYGDTDETKYLPESKVKIQHKGVGCPVSYEHPYAAKYSAGGPGALTDGLRSKETLTAQPDYRLWQGFEGVDLVATVDLRAEMPIEKIAAGFLQNIESWIFLPLWVEFSLSSDGKQFSPLGKIANTTPSGNESILRKSFDLQLSSRRAGYVRVQAKNIGVCPEWHAGKGSKAWLFVDEIEVD